MKKSIYLVANNQRPSNIITKFSLAIYWYKIEIAYQINKIISGLQTFGKNNDSIKTQKQFNPHSKIMTSKLKHFQNFSLVFSVLFIFKAIEQGTENTISPQEVGPVKL